MGFRWDITPNLRTRAAPIFASFFFYKVWLQRLFCSYIHVGASTRKLNKKEITQARACMLQLQLLLNMPSSRCQLKRNFAATHLELDIFAEQDPHHWSLLIVFYSLLQRWIFIRLTTFESRIYVNFRTAFKYQVPAFKIPQKWPSHLSPTSPSCISTKNCGKHRRNPSEKRRESHKLLLLQLSISCFFRGADWSHVMQRTCALWPPAAISFATVVVFWAWNLFHYLLLLYFCTANSQFHWCL